MLEIIYVESKNKDFWYSLDKHLSEQEYEKKVRDKQGYEQLMEMFMVKSL